jgi:predicted esterase
MDDRAFAALSRPLTQKQQRFVSEYLQNGGNQTAAALSAGYSEGAAADMASRMVRNPLIQQAIQRETLTAIGLSVAPALHRVVTLIDHARSDYVKLEAAKDVLNRAGFAAPQRVDHRLDQSLTVHFDLGGSKTAVTEAGDLPDTGKSFEKLIEADANGTGSDGSEGV